MDIKIDGSLTAYTDHKFINELQFQVNQMLTDDRVESFVVATIKRIIIDNTIYLKKQDESV